MQFTAPDLSLIANSLDLLEESYDDANTGRNSTNMDDTGLCTLLRSPWLLADLSRIFLGASIRERTKCLGSQVSLLDNVQFDVHI